MNLKEEIQNRNLLNQYTDEKLFEIYENGGETLYFGVDPSADSMTIAHMIPLMLAINFMKRGNKLIIIVGGATGMIGDPGGKDSERSFLDEETLRKNEKALEQQMDNILENLREITGYKLEFEVINNYDFFKNMDVITFLREAGKYITVNNMMTKETVKNRIEDPDKSISYTEFTYMLLQGYDFWKLFKENGVKLQIAGGDQWGNAVTGIEIIRKKEDQEAYALTAPLVTDSTGKKFGKSEGNAIWLDENKNTPYYVYQYFINTTDEDLERYLKMFTLYSFEEIQEILKNHNENPKERYGQRMLAYFITKLLFGEEKVRQAEKVSRLLFSKEDKLDILKELSDNDIKAVENETGGIQILETVGILDLLVSSGLVNSKGEGRRSIKEGGVYFNEEKIEDENSEISKSDLINEKVGLLRRGKKNYKLITG